MEIAMQETLLDVLIIAGTWLFLVVGIFWTLWAGRGEAFRNRTGFMAAQAECDRAIIEYSWKEMPEDTFEKIYTKHGF